MINFRNKSFRSGLKKVFKQWLSVALSCAALISSSPLSAQEINMRYSDLYNKLKYNLEEGHSDVELQAYLVNKNGVGCNIVKASMRKDEHYEELATSTSGIGNPNASVLNGIIV